MIEAKGLKTLAKALIAIKELDWNLILIGKGDYLQDFKLTLGNAGLERRLIETGYVPHEETPRYLAAMDLLVLPSETQPNWKEQFGRVIPEAMACGTPVVGSDSGEIPNLIKRSRGGLVFPEKDSIQLSQCVRSMMSDESLHSKCATKGRAWVEANISLTAVADCMIRTMQSSKIK
jgi:glycosyltransferase involved in cell wall biosynthesis